MIVSITPIFKSYHEYKSDYKFWKYFLLDTVGYQKCQKLNTQKI